MADFVKKILCPGHEESVPSCALYSDGSAWCFSCQSYFKDLEVPADFVVQPKENINEKIQYILALPTMPHRGLEFHYDNTGYYIVWPDLDYYKCRRWLSNDDRGKYSNPSGIRQPWFTLSHKRPKALCIVEGEINALSLKQAGCAIDITSPGGVSQFNLKNSKLPLNTLRDYGNIFIIVDNMTVGAMAAIKLKTELRPYHHDITIKLLDNDYNEVLVRSGIQELKRIGNTYAI